VSGACSTGTTAPNVTGANDSGAAETSSSGGGSGSASGSGGSSGSSSGGGSSGVQPDAGTPSICDGPGTLVLDSASAFVDDFEECALLPGWSSFNDEVPEGGLFRLSQVSGGAVGTAHSGHYAGMGAVTTTQGGYGVGTLFNVGIRGGGVYCVDISAFDGVSFWAKGATAGSKISLNFVVPALNPIAEHGDCDPTKTTQCFNYPRQSITLTTEWTQYAVRFGDASGGGAKVGGVIQELEWLSPDANWDFSIDEIAFYKGTPPPGPVGSGGQSCAGDGGTGD
jgi:hypothetical protein